MDMFEIFFISAKEPAWSSDAAKKAEVVMSSAHVRVAQNPEDPGSADVVFSVKSRPVVRNTHVNEHFSLNEKIIANIEYKSH